MAQKNSKFLLRILAFYDHSYNPSCWACSSTQLYYKMAQHYRNEVHIEQNTICVPSWRQFRDLLEHKKPINWSSFYNFHFSSREALRLNKFSLDGSFSQFDCMRNSLGEMVRYVINDDPSLCGN